MIRYTERANYTPEQVQQVLCAALAAVEACDVPADLRVTAYAEACRMFSAKSVTAEVPTGPAIDLAALRAGR